MDDLTSVSKLYSIFSHKKWHENHENEQVFNGFCELISHIEPEQKKLLIELVDRYTWITSSEYYGNIVEVFNRIPDEKISSLKELIIFPIMRPEDENVTKSGHATLYCLRTATPYLQRYKNIHFKYIEQLDIVKEKKFRFSRDSAMILLDDFLGSGETITSTLDAILENQNIDRSKLNIVSIASQQQALDDISPYGISIYYNHVFKKGISDYYVGDQLREKIKTMKEIEKLIPANHFPFGYKGSEALITLARTPDNTFPIFWHERKFGNLKFPGPFPRN